MSFSCQNKHVIIVLSKIVFAPYTSNLAKLEDSTKRKSYYKTALSLNVVGLFCMQKIRKEVIRLTAVCCDKKACLNNAKGWCKAKGIHINGMCKSYAEPRTLLRSNNAKVKKCMGKYKNAPGVIK